MSVCVCVCVCVTERECARASEREISEGSECGECQARAVREMRERARAVHSLRHPPPHHQEALSCLACFLLVTRRACHASTASPLSGSTLSGACANMYVSMHARICMCLYLSGACANMYESISMLLLLQRRSSATYGEYRGVCRRVDSCRVGPE